MTCSNCGADVSALVPVVRHLTICPVCRRSIVLEGESARLAVADDTLSLAPEEIAALRSGRRALRHA